MNGNDKYARLASEIVGKAVNFMFQEAASTISEIMSRRKEEYENHIGTDSLKRTRKSGTTETAKIYLELLPQYYWFVGAVKGWSRFY